MLVIGDEILSGRTRDSNMHHLAQRLTEHGIRLMEARVVADDHGAIVAAVVVPPGFGGPEGGIGPGLFQGKPITIEGAVDPSRRAEAGLIAGKLTELGFRQFTRTFQNPDQFRPFMNSAREQCGRTRT